MKSKYVALFLGWLVPGLGHLYAGKRWKAYAFFVTVTACAFTGLAIGDFRNVYFEAGHYQFYAEVGYGLFTLGVSAVFEALRAAPIEATAQASSLAGTIPVADLYVMVAGLLNFVIAANAFDVVAAQEAKKK